MTYGKIGGLLLAAFVVCSGTAPALTPPPSGTDWVDANTNLFLQSEVTRVDVTIAPADLQFFLDNTDTEEYRTCTVRWHNSAIDETHENVAFSIRGNTSRNATRKSWKLDFRQYDPLRTFHGIEEVNLNGSGNDPSIVRSMIAWDFVRRMGLPYLRTHLVALYFNGQFWSVQTHVEHIDEEYAETRFKNKDGNLYKCLYQGAKADLSFVAGEDYAAVGGGQTYRETNNEDDPLHDYTDIAGLIRLISQGTNADILQNLDNHIDVDDFLRYLATDVAVGSWDDYWYGSNNFYMYHNTASQRFEWIPYDYDNTLGIDYFSVNWSTRNFDNWGNGGFGTSPAPMVDKVMQQSEWRRQYRRYLAKAAGILEDTTFRAQATTWNNMVKPYMDGTIESGGTVGSVPFFANALTTPSTWNGNGAQDGHRMGPVPYMIARAASLRTQLGTQTTPALPAVVINEVMSSNRSTLADEAGEFDDWIELYNNSNASIDISAYNLSDEAQLATKFVIPASTVLPAHGHVIIWADDTPAQGPMHAAFKLDAAGEQLALYHNAASGRVLIDTLTYVTTATDKSYGRYPDGSTALQVFDKPTPNATNDNTIIGGGEPRTPPRLFINEFMASNVTSVTDSNGEFDDWAEIYNDESAPVDMTDMGFTDALANPAKWLFPAGTVIPAKGFLLVWCDDAGPGTGVHAGFKLSKGGEALGLFDNELNSRQLIDSFSFGAQVDDISQGRKPNGSAGIVTLTKVTPGASNNDVTIQNTWMIE